jgi:hypothetical protein
MISSSSKRKKKQLRKIDHFFLTWTKGTKQKNINTTTENEHYFDEPDYPVRSTQKGDGDRINFDRDE